MSMFTKIVMVLVMVFTLDTAYTLHARPTLQQVKIKKLELKVDRLELMIKQQHNL